MAMHSIRWGTGKRQRVLPGMPGPGAPVACQPNHAAQMPKTAAHTRPGSR